MEIKTTKTTEKPDINPHLPIQDRRRVFQKLKKVLQKDLVSLAIKRVQVKEVDSLEVDA